MLDDLFLLFMYFAILMCKDVFITVYSGKILANFLEFMPTWVKNKNSDRVAKNQLHQSQVLSSLDHLSCNEGDISL